MENADVTGTPERCAICEEAKKKKSMITFSTYHVLFFIGVFTGEQDFVKWRDHSQDPPCLSPNQLKSLNSKIRSWGKESTHAQVGVRAVSCI